MPGGTFTMGSDHHGPEERPARTVVVEGLFVDRHAVTNRAFAAFVAATGHVTTAERPPAAADHPGVPVEQLVPGSAVFRQPPGPVDLADPSQWWTYGEGACWHQPEGPGSDVEDRLDHPVVHVSYDDAAAYAAWADRSLPTEAEWERAARGGLDGAEFPWGSERPAGGVRANVWEGRFPWEHLRPRPPGTEAVGSYPANDYGLHDVVGNVWEWTTDGVIKGGSFLCSPDHCARDRPAGRMAMTPDSSAANLGFRLVVRKVV